MIIQEIKALQSEALVRADVDSEVESNALLALANGVSLDSLIHANRLSVEQQESVIRRYVNGLLVQN